MGKAVLLAVLLLATRPARAQSDELRPGPWYGWQLILADAAALGLLVVPVSPKAGPVTRTMGMVTFFMDAPILHMAHRNPRTASFSLARIPALVVGRFLGSIAGGFLCQETPACHDRARLLGAGLGVTPVLLFDYITARRPPRSIWAEAPPPVLPAPRLQGWAVALPLVGGQF
jgi:hypothetical protein